MVGQSNLSPDQRGYESQEAQAAAVAAREKAATAPKPAAPAQVAVAVVKNPALGAGTSATTYATLGEGSARVAANVQAGRNATIQTVVNKQAGTDYGTNRANLVKVIDTQQQIISAAPKNFDPKSMSTAITNLHNMQGQLSSLDSDYTAFKAKSDANLFTFLVESSGPEYVVHPSNFTGDSQKLNAFNRLVASGVLKEGNSPVRLGYTSDNTSYFLKGDPAGLTAQQQSDLAIVGYSASGGSRSASPLDVQEANRMFNTTPKPVESDLSVFGVGAFKDENAWKLLQSSEKTLESVAIAGRGLSASLFATADRMENPLVKDVASAAAYGVSFGVGGYEGLTFLARPMMIGATVQSLAMVGVSGAKALRGDSGDLFSIGQSIYGFRGSGIAELAGGLVIPLAFERGFNHLRGSERYVELTGAKGKQVGELGDIKAPADVKSLYEVKPDFRVKEIPKGLGSSSGGFDTILGIADEGGVRQPVNVEGIGDARIKTSLPKKFGLGEVEGKAFLVEDLKFGEQNPFEKATPSINRFENVELPKEYKTTLKGSDLLPEGFKDVDPLADWKEVGGYKVKGQMSDILPDTDFIKPSRVTKPTDTAFVKNGQLFGLEDYKGGKLTNVNLIEKAGAPIYERQPTGEMIGYKSLAKGEAPPESVFSHYSVDIEGKPALFSPEKPLEFKLDVKAVGSRTIVEIEGAIPFKVSTPKPTETIILDNMTITRKVDTINNAFKVTGKDVLSYAKAEKASNLAFGKGESVEVGGSVVSVAKMNPAAAKVNVQGSYGWTVQVPRESTGEGFVAASSGVARARVAGLGVVPMSFGDTRLRSPLVNIVKPSENQSMIPKLRIPQLVSTPTKMGYDTNVKPVTGIKANTEAIELPKAGFKPFEVIDTTQKPIQKTIQAPTQFQIQPVEPIPFKPTPAIPSYGRFNYQPFGGGGGNEGRSQGPSKRLGFEKRTYIKGTALSNLLDINLKPEKPVKLKKQTPWGEATRITGAISVRVKPLGKPETQLDKLITLHRRKGPTSFTKEKKARK